MRVLILADIHGNMPALSEIAEKESWDLMICLGDLVDYGPWPDEVIDFIMENADYVILGNHDYSLAFGGDCGCSPEYVDVTMYSRKATINRISVLQRSYLASLPERLDIEIDGKNVHLVHGSIKHPLYGFVTPFVDKKIIWDEMGDAEGIVLFGHSHIDMYKKLKDNLVIINPGSVGFPKGNDPRTSYIIYENGRFHQKKLEYDVEKVVQGLMAMDMPDEIKNALIDSVREGR